MLYAYCRTCMVSFCVSLLLVQANATTPKPEINERNNEMKNSENRQPSDQPNRPQEPKQPYPYREEEVLYENKDDQIALSGTLTFPQKNGNFPAAVLITGYGPNDRNATGMGHKYFLVLADYLTRQGIAVLRFDKRGVGKSTGDYTLATSEDLARDVLAGIQYLKTRNEIDSSQIGLIGLSEGGLIAAMVAAQSPDVAFSVLMAPALAMKIDDMIYHAARQLQADGATDEFIKNDRTTRKAVYTIIKEEVDQSKAQKMIRTLIEDYCANIPESQKLEAQKLPFAFTPEKIDGLTKVLTSPAYRFFLNYDPSVSVRKITTPIFTIIGDHDYIVSAAKIFPILKNACQESGNRNCTMIELPNLNHLFQTCKTGSLMEYGALEETMSPLVLKLIADWIIRQQ